MIRTVRSCLVFVALLASAAAVAAPQDLKSIAAMIEHGQAAAAEQQLRRFVAQPPGAESAQAWLLLARLQSGRKDTPGALESLRKARTLAPNSEEVLSALSQVALRAHAFGPAVATLQSLARMCPTVAQYHYLLGVALMEAGDSSSAEEALRRAEQIEPNRMLTLVAFGLVLNNGKQFAQAKPFLLRAVDLEPESADALAALAETEEGLGELPQAESHVRRALDTASATPSALATANLVLGTLLMKQEHYADAREALEKAVAANPDSAKAHYQLSLAYARTGDAANAQKQVALYQQALRDTEARVKALHKETGLP
jgi:tetratricopeptide (TPR) repeat protein